MVDCAQVIKEAHNLTDREAKEIVAALRAVQKSRAAEQGVGSALLKLAQDTAKSSARAARVARYQAKLNLIKKARAEKFMGQFDDEFKALDAFLVGSDAKVAGAQYSVDATQKAYRAEIMGGVLRDLEKGHEGILKLLRQDEFNRDVAREMWGGLQQSVTGNADAFHAAQVFERYKEILRKTANREGADIARLPGHVMTQNHDARLLMKAGFEEWKNAILPLLDHNRTFGAEPAEPMLRRIYDSVAAGNTVLLSSEHKALSPTNIANRLSQSRVLHFADADSFFTYNNRFGKRSVVENILGRMERMSDQVGLMMRLGPNPERMFEKLLERQVYLAKKAGRPLKGHPVNALRSRFTVVSGKDKIPGDPSIAFFSAQVRNVQSMANLGSAVISSFTDMATSAANLNYHGRGFLDAYADVFRGLVKGRAKGELKEIATLLGTFGDGVLSSVAGRFNATDGLAGGTSKLTNLFFKMNGLDWWTDVMKEGHSLALSRHLAGSLGKPLDALDKGLRENLSRYGIGQQEWGILQRADLREVEGARYLTPDAVGELPAFKGQEDMVRKLRAFFINEADFGVPTPGARERAISLQGTQPGTVYGEFARFAWQFKMFPLTLLTRVWPRIMRSGMPGAIHLALMTTMFGYLSMSTKDILRGREIRSPDDWKAWAAAMQQGGGAGIMGDLIFNDFNQFGRSLPEVLGGPVLGAVGDVARVASSGLRGRDVSAKTLRFVMNNTPFSNLFYARTAIDYLWTYQMQELMNPGYLRRMEREISRRNNQGFFMKPSDVIAYGGGFR